MNSEFTDKVLQVICSIPCGAVLSYKKIAVYIENELASRAVANVCAGNKYPIMIPCHRVVPSKLYNVLQTEVKLSKRYLDDYDKNHIYCKMFESRHKYVGGYVFGSDFKYKLLCFEAYAFKNKNLMLNNSS